MTVGRSEQAKTLVVESERNVLRTVGWVPRVTFFRSLSKPAEKEYWCWEMPQRSLEEQDGREQCGYKTLGRNEGGEIITLSAKEPTGEIQQLPVATASPTNPSQ